jgi:hypothetical protein
MTHGKALPAVSCGRRGRDGVDTEADCASTPSALPSPWRVPQRDWPMADQTHISICPQDLGKSHPAPMTNDMRTRWTGTRAGRAAWRGTRHTPGSAPDCSRGCHGPSSALRIGFPRFREAMGAKGWVVRFYLTCGTWTQAGCGIQSPKSGCQSLRCGFGPPGNSGLRMTNTGQVKKHGHLESHWAKDLGFKQTTQALGRGEGSSKL